MVNTLVKTNPNNHIIFPPIICTQASFTQTSGCRRKSNLSDVFVCIHDLCFLSFCTHILFFFGSTAQHTDWVLGTTTPGCCWGSLNESRTRGQLTSFPTGHATPGSGTAVTSEYNVMSVLPPSPSNYSSAVYADFWSSSQTLCAFFIHFIDNFKCKNIFNVNYPLLYDHICK